VTVRWIPLLTAAYGALRHETRPSEEDLNKYRVRPTLTLVIECRQSDLPYTFFVSEKTLQPTFPLLAGLASDDVEVVTDDDRSKWTYSVLHALDLIHHPFITEPPICYTFSKCVRKGDQLQLSGSDAYNQLIMPIMSAMYHFKVSCLPHRNAVLL
jgi:hypothetical protein